MRNGRIAGVLLAAALASCGGDGGGGGGGGGGLGGGTISGVVTYDRVPTSRSNGLLYGSTERRPVRGALVRLLDARTSATLATAATDDGGAYALDVPASAPAAVTVAVLAQSASPPVSVRDNTDRGAQWFIGTPAFAPGGAQTRDLHAASGWTGASYGAAREAAPFAILDTMVTAARAFLAVRPAVSLPPLTVFWSPENVTELGDPATGRIVTSHWNGQALFILGEENVDTDEYDEHVLVHEWGHYYESALARSDSPGGRHGEGDVKDPRLAWSEGWGNAVSAILLADSSYRDTGQLLQAGTTIEDDLEDNATGLDTGDPNPGWWSEASIARLLVDLADPPNDDPVAVGLGAIHDALAGAARETAALATVFSFVTALRQQPGVDPEAIDALVAARRILPRAQDPPRVQDEFATGVTHPTDGMPLYLPLGLGAPTPLTLDAPPGAEFNDLGQNRYLTVSGTGGQLTVRATSVRDVAVQVFRRGELVAAADQLLGDGVTLLTEEATFPTTPNEPHVVVVTGVESGVGPYAVTLQVD